MARKALVIAGTALAVVFLAGCRTAPVHNVVEAPVPAIKRNYKQEDLRAAIVRAGGGLGWRMSDHAPGHLVGTLALRSHIAVVDVLYDADSYSIKYKDSTNLDYDGKSIHSNYNGWIQNLDNAIRVQMQTL